MAIPTHEALTFDEIPLVGEGIVEGCRAEADHILVHHRLAAIKQNKIRLIDQQEAGWLDLIGKADCRIEDDLRDRHLK